MTGGSHGLQCCKEQGKHTAVGEGGSTVSLLNLKLYFPVYGQEWSSVYGIIIIFHYTFYGTVTIFLL